MVASEDHSASWSFMNPSTPNGPSFFPGDFTPITTIPPREGIESRNDGLHPFMIPPSSDTRPSLKPSYAAQKLSASATPELLSASPKSAQSTSSSSRPAVPTFIPNPTWHEAKSETEDIQAGWALAEMGMSGRRKSTASPPNPEKKVKKRKASVPKENNPAQSTQTQSKRSCAECRRLKAKCDRVFPCSNCRRRGCALVCPDGDLSCMQGKRLVLASTEQLHDRIQQLESALSQAHSKVSPTSHPLLTPQFLDGGGVKSEQKPFEHMTHDALAVDGPLTPSSRMAVESLILNEDAAAPEGRNRDQWFGQNAACAMMVAKVGRLWTDDPAAMAQTEIVERLTQIVKVLPSQAEVSRRSSNFLKTSIWYNNILREDEYKRIYEAAVFNPTADNPLTPHKLAIVLIVLALDTYFDPTMEEGNAITESYWSNFQQCFDTRFGWASSVAGVQAMALAAIFVGFGWRGSRVSNFYWLRQMTTLAQQIGLHKDPPSHLSQEEKDFRRRVFYEVYGIDCLISINHGQNTGIDAQLIETDYPGDAIPFMAFKYQWFRSTKSAVIYAGCLPDTNPAKPEKIKELDETLTRTDHAGLPDLHCPFLSHRELPPQQHDTSYIDVPNLVRTMTSLCHFKAVLFLHRPSLRRLIARIRSGPPQTPQTLTNADKLTISSTYGACKCIIACSLYMARTNPVVSSRTWSTWVQAFSAASSMAALAIWCGPLLESTFIRSAYSEVSQACQLIKENNVKRTAGVLPLLPMLQSIVTSRYPQVINRDPRTAQINIEGENMLFALLGGKVNDTTPMTHQEANISTTTWTPTADLIPTNFPIMPPQDTFDFTPTNEMSQGELWARLQTFYEPALFWGNGGQVPPIPGMY